MEAYLGRLHARAHRNPLLQRLAVITRLLLAVGFIPPSLVKIRGHRFMTAVTPGNPISDFFESMYHSGAYWRLIGWAQLVAGVLLLVPRTATLGAVLCFPIILNIFIITVALHFTGTPVITGLMLLAALYLPCWDYHRLKWVIWKPAGVDAVEPARTRGLRTRHGGGDRRAAVDARLPDATRCAGLSRSRPCRGGDGGGGLGRVAAQPTRVPTS